MNDDEESTKMLARVGKRALVCAVSGSISGITLAAIRGERLVLYGTSMGANFGLIGATYFLSYELIQKMRPATTQRDIRPAVLSGVISGALWGTLYGGIPRGAQGAVLFGSIGLLGFMAQEEFQEWRIRKGHELYHARTTEVVVAEVKEHERGDYFWPSWLPLYKVSDEEIERRVQQELEKNRNSSTDLQDI